MTINLYKQLNKCQIIKDKSPDLQGFSYKTKVQYN